MEIRLAIAMFVWNFHAQFVEEGQKEPYFKDGLVAYHGSLCLRIKPVAQTNEMD